MTSVKSDQKADWDEWTCVPAASVTKSTSEPAAIKPRVYFRPNCVREIVKALSPKMKSNKKVVMAAVKRNGDVLEFASPELKADKDVVLAAMDSTCYTSTVLRSISPVLLSDKQFLLDLMAKCEFRWKHSLYALTSTELKDDKDFALIMVKDYGFCLSQFSEQLRADKDVVMAAIELDGTNIKYCSSELRADKDVVLAAVKTFPKVLCSASEDLKDEEEIVLAALGVRFS